VTGILNNITSAGSGLPLGGLPQLSSLPSSAACRWATCKHRDGEQEVSGLIKKQVN